MRTVMECHMRYLDRLSQIDPERITVDTVKLMFPFTPKWMARQIIRTGIRRGEFLLNPDGSARLAERGHRCPTA